VYSPNEEEEEGLMSRGDLQSSYQAPIHSLVSMPNQSRRQSQMEQGED